METLKKSFGRRFRALRESRGYSRDYLAQNVEIDGESALDEQSIYRLEKGEQWIAPEKLEKMAEFFGVSPAVFFTDDVVRINPTPEEAWEIVGKALQKTPGALTFSVPGIEEPEIMGLLDDLRKNPDAIGAARVAARGSVTPRDKLKERSAR